MAADRMEKAPYGGGGLEVESRNLEEAAGASSLADQPPLSPPCVQICDVIHVHVQYILVGVSELEKFSLSKSEKFSLQINA